MDMYAGDTKIINITITENNNPVDLTGASIKFGFTGLVKETGNGITITDAINGACQVKLEPQDTENLLGIKYYECEVTDAQGNVSTVLEGSLLIKGSKI